MTYLPKAPLCRYCGCRMTHPEDLTSGAHTACTIRREETKK